MLHKLELAVVCILKLIYQNVAEALLIGLERSRMCPKQGQGEGHLVAEVYAAGLGLELVIGGVGAGELVLAPGRLGEGLVFGVCGALLAKALSVFEVLIERDVFVAASAE